MPDASRCILRFWRDLEIFNIPDAPSHKDNDRQTKVSTVRDGNLLPWQDKAFAVTDEYTWIHGVYLGAADKEYLTQQLLRSLFPAQNLSERERERISGTGWLAAFMVDGDGHVKPDSYLPASFTHGVAALRENARLDDLNARLAQEKEEFAQRCHEVDADKFVLDWQALARELQHVCALLGESADNVELDFQLVVRSRKVKRRFVDSSVQDASDFLNSFYLDDLDRLIAQAEKNTSFGAALNAYLGPMLDEKKRVDILADQQALSALVSAKDLPGARWPSSPHHPLFLAQQAAVAHTLSSLQDSTGLMGINGPPGTGKTTLLKDVMANVVTERARRIAALQNPADLFAEKIRIADKNFFPLKTQIIAGTTIVVASSNNNAVKNITQELPARKELADEFSEADYFSEVMDEIFKAQDVKDGKGNPVRAWGLIAAALGNAGNRRTFAQGFFRDEPRQNQHQNQATQQDEAAPISIKQILEAATQPDQYTQHQRDWQQAKQLFLELHREVQQYREQLLRTEQAKNSIASAQKNRAKLADEVQQLQQDIKAGEEKLIQLQQQQADQRALMETHQTILDAVRAATGLSLWDRMLEFFGIKTRRMLDLRQSLQGPIQALAQSSINLIQIGQEISHIAACLKQQREHQQHVIREQASIEKQCQHWQQILQTGVARQVRHFPDAAFWELPIEQRHRASVLVSPELDRLRAKLFLHAVELHRLTLLAAAGKFIANLRLVYGMLTGNLRDKLLIEHRPLLWDALFFVVPVVSTTLASFDRLFVGMGQDSLGWLLIDEAGQATPQSAAGALWRSRRAVIVGDPLQIEPVFTVPYALVEDIRKRHAVSAHWSPIHESVQTLADRITPFGTWVDTGTSAQSEAIERLWTGMPLRTHLRCDEPMFSISNQIAYAGQMVHGRVDKAGQLIPQEFPCPLGESSWFDVRPDTAAHPVVHDEINCLLDCLRQLPHAPNQSETNIYVISPFRKVASACRARISQAKLNGIECGTVHTFQGKEAAIVFLILGTAPGPSGAGARHWAASKPNLLNVAVTRAKCRLYVIGNASAWGGLAYFGELHRALPVRQIALAALPP